MKRLLGVNIKPTQRPAPTGDAMDWYLVVHFGVSALRARKCDDIDIMPPVPKFVRKHTNVKVSPTD